MKRRRKVSDSQRQPHRREKLLAPEWDGLDPAYRAFYGSDYEDNPEWGLGAWTPDLRSVASTIASEKTELLRQFLSFPYNMLVNLPGGKEYIADQPRGLTAQLPNWAWLIINNEIQSALKAGFFFAVKRYADELRDGLAMPELIVKRIDAAHKGGEARRTNAEPRRKCIRKRFRELRKTSPKKTVRYRRLADEFDLSDRQIARIVADLD